MLANRCSRHSLKIKEENLKVVRNDVTLASDENFEGLQFVASNLLTAVQSLKARGGN